MQEPTTTPPGWGSRQTYRRNHVRRQRTIVAVLAAASAPFTIPLIATTYNMLALPDRAVVSPAWLVLGAWSVALSIVILAGALLVRGTDEMERRWLVDAAGVTGAVMTVLLPPAIFASGLLGFFAAEAAMAAWAVALLAGLVSYAVARVRH